MTEEERNLDFIISELEQENRLLRARNERLEKREWVGLADEELLGAYGFTAAPMLSDSIVQEAKRELLGTLRKVEAAIKEKNT
ncbi:MAG: hypothetical protein ACKO0Z_27995 [Betaproteobacteria bacterium]